MNRTSRRQHLTRLRRTLVTRFDDSELRTLCFDLGIDYADLPGEGRADKARELLAYLDRRDRIHELLEVGQRMRPDVPWSQVYLDDRMDILRDERDEADRARREMRERQRVVNLRPLDVTHTFKDRVREVQALCDHLTDNSVRLVSVVGRGGMGKTALVSRVLGDLEQGVLPVSNEEKGLPIDGILYLSARSTGLGLERIYADVGRMLGEPVASKLEARWADRSMPLTAKIEYMLEVMQDGQYLILLDNLETAMAEDGTIIEDGLRLFIECCLTQPSGVRLIVTSREQVKIAAAVLHSMRSIPLREGLPEDEAVALLRDLDPQGSLGLRAAPEEKLQRAAQLTQSIPRALEILAGILHEDPTASLHRLLADEGLFGEQVVEQLVAAGHSRLGEAERRVIEALAVFDQPVEETSIGYLLHPWWPGLDVRSRLHRLIRGYFVSVNRVTGRYSLHPLDRDYAYRQIPDAIDKEPDSYNRHNLELRAADFYASIRKPESEWKSVDDLESQLAEFEHRVRAGDYDDACRVLKLIDSDYLYRWGHYGRLVALGEEVLGHLTNPGLRADTLHSLGDACYALGQVKCSAQLYDEALDIAREIGDRTGEGRNLRDLGLAYHALGQVERAIEFYREALDIFSEIGDRQREGRSLSSLGLAYRDMGQVEQAIHLYEEALDIAHEIDDLWGEGTALASLGSAFRGLGQVERAIGFYEGALDIFSEIEYRLGESVCHVNLGIVYRSLGRIERAIKSFEKALDITRKIGDRRGQGVQLGNLGLAFQALGQIHQAINLQEEALAIARQIGHRRGEGISLGNVGNIYYALGEFERAIELYEQALGIIREIDDRRWESYQLLGMSRALLASGSPSEAYPHCAEALALDIPDTSYRVSLMLGTVLLGQGNAAAGETFADAVARCRAMLEKATGSYEPRYALASALVGSAVCNPRWDEESERAELLAPGLAEYRQALEYCSARGVVHDAIRDLELIQAAGIKGLEPAFELLESTLEQ